MVALTIPGWNTCWVEPEKGEAGIYRDDFDGQRKAVLLRLDFPQGKPYFVNGLPVIGIDRKRSESYQGRLLLHNISQDNRKEITERVLEVLTNCDIESFGR